MEKKIYIKAFFGDWKEVTFEKACEFFQNRVNMGASLIGLKKTFLLHFKGVPYEEILEHIKK